MSDSTTDRNHDHRNRKAAIILLGLGVCLVVLAVFSFLVGRFPISPDKVVGILASGFMPLNNLVPSPILLIFCVIASDILPVTA